MVSKEGFRLSDSRQQRIHRRLELIGPGPADFFHDACRFMATEPHFRSTTHLVSHALREIESSLRDVLETYMERAERLEEEKKKKNVSAEENHRKEILAILRGLGISEDDRVVQAWLRLPGKENEFALHARAHRDNLDRARPLNAEFRQFWDDMQAVLDLILQKFESRYLESFRVLDELLTKPVPTKADLKVLRLNVPNNRVAFRYFFDRLNSPDWIKPLRDRGFFKNTLEPELNPETGGLMHSYWAQSRYLARMAAASSASAETQRAVLNIALGTETENVLTQIDFVDAASAMPPTLGGELVPKAVEWLMLSSQTMLPVKLAALVALLAGGGEVAAALRLARAVFTVSPDPSDSESADDTDGNVFWSPTPRAHFRRGQYRQELRKNFPAVVEAAGLSALSLLCDLLEDAIRLSQRRRERAEGEDRSHVWQPEVENERDSQPRNWLVAAVLSASEQIIEKDRKRLPEIVALVEARQRSIFKRIALQLLRKSTGDDPEVRDLISARLSDRELFAAWELKHEYFSLAEAHFAQLSPAEKERILSWIDDGPDVEVYRRNREWLHGTLPNEEDVADYIRRWKLERLAPLRVSLTGRRKEEFDELNATLGELNIATPRPVVQMVDRELESPKSKDEFRSMGVDEIILFLRSWQASGNHGEASRAGLRYELASVIAEEPDRFAVAAAEFGGLGPAHLGTLISGLRQAVTNRIPFSWYPVLETCRTGVSLGGRADSVDTRNESRESDVYSLKQSITELLKAGLSRSLGAAEIPLDLRDIVWDTLRPLTDEFDAPPRQHTVYYSSDESDGKPGGVNSIRVEAMNCVLQYAEWVERHLEADSSSEERSALSFDDMPEVREILNKHLDPEYEPALAVREFYGRAFPHLCRIDPKWAAENNERVFPSQDDLLNYYRAAWEEYIIFNDPYNVVFDVLRDEYGRAVDLIGTETLKERHSYNPEEYLAQHLMLLYVRGKLDLDEPGGLLECFFARASNDLRAYAIALFRQSFSPDANELPDAFLERLRALWMHRLEAVRRDNSLRDELVFFGWWVPSEQFESRWVLLRLKETLELARWVEPDHMVVERLSALAPAEPLLTIECLTLMVEGAKEDWQIEGWSSETSRVFAAVLASLDELAREKAKDIINSLATRGHLGFAELLRGNKP